MRRENVGRIAVIFQAIVSVLLVAQSAPEAIQDDAVKQSDAAYEELSAGQTESAIARLEQARDGNPDDPALLINLGTAYSRAGRVEEAREAFRAAIASGERYRVELADGSWEDSRTVARVALESLERTAFAAK